MSNKNYTHRDSSGMPWRFEGSRPVSALADMVMREVQQEMAALKPVRKKKKRK